MKIVVKRVYCPHDRMLVRAREETVSHQTLVSCTRCGRLLYSWNGIRWKPSTEPAAAK